MSWLSCHSCLPRMTPSVLVKGALRIIRPAPHVSIYAVWAACPSCVVSASQWTSSWKNLASYSKQSCTQTCVELKFPHVTPPALCSAATNERQVEKKVLEMAQHASFHQHVSYNLSTILHALTAGACSVFQLTVVGCTYILFASSHFVFCLVRTVLISFWC